MAFSYGFYNSIEGDRQYDANQFSALFDGLITDGVFETYEKAFLVLATDEENSVIVQSGRAWFDHTWNYNDSSMVLKNEQGTPVGGFSRIDAVVIDINSADDSRENSIIWVCGEEASSDPEKPTLEDSDTHHQYPLCYVSRSTSDDGIITQSVITNTIGTSECPFVTGVVSGVTTDELLAQWNDEFTTWFERMKGQLSEDAAGNLQLQIDDMSDTLNTTVEKLSTELKSEIDDVTDTINSNLVASDGTQFRFGVDEDGKYGYITTGEDGADTVTPFRNIGDENVWYVYVGTISTGITGDNNRTYTFNTGLSQIVDYSVAYIVGGRQVIRSWSTSQSDGVVRVTYNSIQYTSSDGAGVTLKCIAYGYK